jgi:hypothetical protein
VACGVAVGRACSLCDQPTMAKGKAKSPVSKPTEVAATVRAVTGVPRLLYGNVAWTHLLQHSCDSHWPIGFIKYIFAYSSLVIMHWTSADVAHLACCSPRRPWT